MNANTRPMPTVAIVGRTNVGKSSLFNKLISEEKSLVSAVPGTTRDRFEADCIWRGMVIRVMDTGGLDVDLKDEIERNIALQAKKAVELADIILFVVDAQSGIQPEDLQLAKQFLGSKKPVFTVANKADNQTYVQDVEQWGRWPLGTITPVSAFRSIGLGDLLDLIFAKMKENRLYPIEVREITSLRVATVGRPNVGKSSLLNSMLGEHRFIEADMEHTTREPNDTQIVVNNQRYTLVDTAGVRKLARVNASASKLEKSGVSRTMRAVHRADVALFVLDINQEIEQQDKFLAGELSNARASVIIIANKWDLIEEKDPNSVNRFEEYIRAHLPSLKYAPIVFTSAKTGQRVTGLFDTIDKVYQSRFTQLSQTETHEFMSRSIVKHKPSRGTGVAHPTIISFKQAGINPPLFHLTIRQKRTDSLNQSYLRFLENQLRTFYDFEGTPISIKIISKRKKHTTY